MSRIVKVSVPQFASGKTPEENIKIAERVIREAAKKGAQIICLQELFTTLYFCQTEDYQPFEWAEAIPGNVTNHFSPIAKELNVVLVLSYFEKAMEGVNYNSAAVIDADGSYLGKYRKMHIPDDPGFYEKFYFVPGDLGFKVFETKYGKISVLICWDQWYPEAARISSLMGAEILFYPTAIGWDAKEPESYGKDQLEAWITAQRAHSIANGVFVATSNRIGIEHEIKFWGNSFVFNPFGVKKYEAGHYEEEIPVVECDLNEIEHYRLRWPFFRDRRVDSFNDIQKRHF